MSSPYPQGTNQIVFDNYIYNLSTASPQTVLSVDLPKDLVWNDELNWTPVAQDVEWSLSGALLIQEGVKLKGRSITLVAPSNMVWITRAQGLTLQQMNNTAGMVMTFSFLDSTNRSNVLFSYNTMFRHAEGGLDLENIKDFDAFEATAWYTIKSIKLMEVLPYGQN